MSRARTLYLHAITPVHSGTGQTVAVIDLPVAREKATGYPLIPASSLKGVLRDKLAITRPKEEIERVFGTQEGAGILCFADQRILCLPVRSYFGTFAYVTCPLTLQRLTRDLKAMGIALPFSVNIPGVTDTDSGLSVHLATDSALARNQNVYLEDLDLIATISAEIGAITSGFAQILFAGDTKAFTSRFALVSDEVFSFLSETATEVTARVALQDETKTVKRGGLWYEEAVPAEAIFWGPVLIESRNMGEAESVLEELKQIGPVQIGGNASVGRGLCRVVVTEA